LWTIGEVVVDHERGGNCRRGGAEANEKSWEYGEAAKFH
jgi:hypothetical protein